MPILNLINLLFAVKEAEIRTTPIRLLGLTVVQNQYCVWGKIYYSYCFYIRVDIKYQVTDPDREWLKDTF